jgi:hypothetical protein
LAAIRVYLLTHNTALEIPLSYEAAIGVGLVELVLNDGFIIVERRVWLLCTLTNVLPLLIG